MATETKKLDVVPVKKDTSVLESEKPPDVTMEVTDAQSSPVMIVNKAGRLISKIIKWVGLITLIIFLVTNKLAREKIISVFESVKKGSVKQSCQQATVTWWKDPSVYGTNPNQRKGGPFDAKILKNDDLALRFEVYYLQNGTTQKGLFKGERISPERIEGTWNQNYPQDGGDWKLKQDFNNPRLDLFVGKYSCKTGEWINFKLRIELED